MHDLNLVWDDWVKYKIYIFFYLPESKMLAEKTQITSNNNNFD